MCARPHSPWPFNGSVDCAPALMWHFAALIITCCEPASPTSSPPRPAMAGRAVRGDPHPFAEQSLQHRCERPLAGDVATDSFTKYFRHALSLPNPVVPDRTLWRIPAGFLQARRMEGFLNPIDALCRRRRESKFQRHCAHFRSQLAGEWRQIQVQPGNGQGTPPSTSVIMVCCCGLQ
ncbi:MAG: hypothetical protein QOJ15_7353 [Bradyrhizobium sp.]|jgi:hypothetical protein|nr:hypothetical protein [Bradyrhizobium sp.]